jgi:hypothetical protein
MKLLIMQLSPTSCYFITYPIDTNIPCTNYHVESGWCSQYSDQLWAGRLRSWSSSPSRVKNFLASTLFRLFLEATQSPIQWVPGALSLWVKLATHLQLVLRSRKCGSIHPLPHMPSWCSA